MDEAETKSPSPNGKGLLRAPIVCERWRTAGLLRLAQEADSNRDCLDILIVALGKGAALAVFSILRAFHCALKCEVVEHFTTALWQAHRCK